MSAETPHIIQLPIIPDERGNLSFFEHPNQIPFAIKRTYWIHDIPGGENKGHAFKTQNEFIVALSGSFDILVNNGFTETLFSLNRPHVGLFVPKMHWRKLQNIATNSVVLVVSDSEFDTTEYIREFDEFQNENGHV